MRVHESLIPFGRKLSCALIDSHQLSSTLNMFTVSMRVDESFSVSSSRKSSRGLTNQLLCELITLSLPKEKENITKTKCFFVAPFSVQGRAFLVRRVSKCFKESTKSCSRKPALLTLYFSDLNLGPFRVYFVRALRLSNRISNHVAQNSVPNSL